MSAAFSSSFGPPEIGALSSFYKFHTIDVLRLDVLHPVISGNKWFKLKKYLEAAVSDGKRGIITFGGAWSNHLVAAAAAAHASGLQSIGIVRGERPEEASFTLQQAHSFGMRLHFISRKAYGQKEVPAEIFKASRSDDWLMIPEGGYGPLGRDGAASILSAADTSGYTDIVAALGTGTMLAGLAMAAGPQQRVTGISVLKNHHTATDEIRALLPRDKWAGFRVLTHFHGGGYARAHPDLFSFMNQLYAATGLPSDFVYTGKLFRAVPDLIGSGYFPEGSRVLLIHSGGLQGNRSLPPKTLLF